MYNIIEECLYRFNNHQLEKADYHNQKLKQTDSFVPRMYHGFWLKFHESMNYIMLSLRNRRLLRILDEMPEPVTDEDRRFWEEFDNYLKENPFRL